MPDLSASLTLKSSARQSLKTVVSARYMAPLLCGVGTGDPITFAAVPLVLLAVALAASWIPAMRATRVDPVVTLRQE